MRSFVVAISTLCLLSSPLALTAAETITLPNCWLSLDEEVLVPAQEPGVLVEIPVREGQQVTKGQLLAQIDNLIPRAKQNVAHYKLEVAKKQATDDIDVQYATAAFQYARAKVQRDVAANARTPGTITDEVLEEHQLEREKFRLAIDKAKKDLDVNALQQEVANAELEAAKADVEHRRLIAPLDAEVIELSRHVGEWVQAGDPVMRLLRLDKLRVQGLLTAKKYQISDVKDRPVQVTVTLSRGQRQSFPGKIVFVNPLIRVGGEFEVRAEVQNRKEGDSWILSPGLGAEMTIELK
jgi:multidrug efflux pump subunit AcrA (membrane-fusion protein)